MQKNKVKLLPTSLCILVIMALFSEAKSETVIETIQRTGLLRVGVREDAVPFGYRDLNNNLSGLCLDFIYLLRKKVREELNQNIITIKLYKSTLFNRFDMVENRVVDLECGPNSIQKNIDRNVEFSRYFFITGTQFFIRQEDKNKLSFNANLSNLTLGVLSETTTQKFIQEKYPLAQLQEFQGVTGRLRGVQAVQSGKIDAFVSDGILLLGEATLMGLSLEDYQIVPQKPLNCEYYGLLLPKNDPQWRDFVNSTIEQAQTLNILKDWFTVVAPYIRETFQFCQQTPPQID